MLIELTGATVCVIGKLKGWPKAAITEAVEAAGGTLKNTPPKGCLALVGMNPSEHKLAKASARGCTMLDHDDAIALLSDGFVEREDAPTRTLDELVGEARGVLAKGPGRETFDALVALLDGCEPDHLDDLANYITPQLADWPIARDTPEQAQRHARHADISKVTGPFSDAGGSMRLMPVGWVTDLIADGPSPKHRICDTLSFSGVKVSTSAAAKVFAHGPLEHLRAFSIGETTLPNMKKKTFFKKMVASGALPNVHTFTLHRCHPDGITLLAEHPECLPSLTTLHLYAMTDDMRRMGDTTASGAILAGAWGDQLETLGVSCSEQVVWLREHRDALPMLDHVLVRTSILELGGLGRSHGMYHLPHALEGVRTLTFGGNYFPLLRAYLSELGAHPPRDVRTLDLSPMLSGDICAAEPAAQLADTILTGGLPGVLERVVVNGAFAPSFARSLAGAGLTVETVELS
jgi:hypothetical protein